MVKSNKSKKRKNSKYKGFKAKAARARKINASTPYETCTEQLSPFGGLLSLIKFLDLIDFKQIFNFGYIAPRREPKLGHYRMVVGLLMLLFIGFNRIWHFTYIRLDAMLCGFFRCVYQPIGWKTPHRFVAMRIPKKQHLSKSNQPVQCELFTDDQYTYRIFCTDLSAKAHEVIGQYDKRADVENLVGEAKREGLGAIPSAKFKNNYAFFQVVMLAYNIWRYMKLTASANPSSDQPEVKILAANTIRIARLKLLFIAAKVVKDQNRDKVKFSIHDARTPTILGLLTRLDEMRSNPRPWAQNDGWPQRFVFEI